jgi:hypothetical protein
LRSFVVCPFLLNQVPPLTYRPTTANPNRLLFLRQWRRGFTICSYQIQCLVFLFTCAYVLRTNANCVLCSIPGIKLSRSISHISHHHSSSPKPSSLQPHHILTASGLGIKCAVFSSRGIECAVLCSAGDGPPVYCGVLFCRSCILISAFAVLRFAALCVWPARAM